MWRTEGRMGRGTRRDRWRITVGVTNSFLSVEPILCVNTVLTSAHAVSKHIVLLSFSLVNCTAPHRLRREISAPTVNSWTAATRGLLGMHVLFAPLLPSDVMPLAHRRIPGIWRVRQILLAGCAECSPRNLNPVRPHLSQDHGMLATEDVNDTLHSDRSLIHRNQGQRRWVGIPWRPSFHSLSLAVAHAQTVV